MDKLAEEPRRGLVYTFYSFKGGVGRSMALANIAALLARWGQRVLVVDWDLEAPGLEKFFQRWISGSRTSTPGLVELFHGYAESPPLDWRACRLRVSLPQAQRIDLITAGRDDADYGTRLQALNWEQLFKEGRLGAYLEDLRREWVAEYDFVLVDSRTGITDIGGICTIHLPDVLVCFFTTTEQSLQGVKDVMQRARRGHGGLPVDRRRLLIVPVPARDESRTEYKLTAEWRERFAAELESFYGDWIPKEESAITVLDLLKIPYVAFWSFGERLPVLEEDTENPDKLAFFYQLLGRLILGRLDLKEVKRGGQAAQAREEQRRESERRTSEAALAREKAEREVAEQDRAKREEAEQQLRLRLEDYLRARWTPALFRFMSARVRYRMTGLLVPLAAVVLYLSTVLAGGWWTSLGLPDSYPHLILPMVSLSGLVLGLVCLIVARRNEGAADELRQERALFEGNAGRYYDYPPPRAFSLFLEVSEQIITSGLERGSLITSLRTSFQRIAQPVALASDSALPASAGDPAGPPKQATGEILPAVSSSPAPPSATETYDVYVSYARDRVTSEWLREFRPLFVSWLSDLVGHKPAVFLDENELTTGEDWPATLRAARERSTCMLAIVSPAYFRSSAGEEWKAYLESRPEMIVPVLLRGSIDQLPEAARRLQFADFREFALVGEGFRKTERYVDFQLEVRKLAERVAQVVARQPPDLQHSGESGDLSPP